MTDESTGQVMTPVEASQTATPSVEITPSAAIQTPEATPEDAGQVDQSPPTRKGLKELLAADPELQREYDEDHNRRIQKATSKLEKKHELEKLTRAAEDPVLSLTDTQERKAALEKELAADTGLQSKWGSITADVNETAAKNPKWKDDYAAVLEANRKEADNLFATDPDKYRDWVDEKIEDLRVERRFDKAIKERLPTLVEAGITDHDNKRMQGLPEMPIGNGGTSDAALLASVKNMSGQEYLANKERIYAAIRRKQD